MIESGNWPDIRSGRFQILREEVAAQVALLQGQDLALERLPDFVLVLIADLGPEKFLNQSYDLNNIFANLL
jgi:hypothetical protein